MAAKKVSKSDKKLQYNIEHNKLIERLKAEPKLKVYGNSMFSNYLGTDFTFLYNGLPVSIKFDGTWQEYPETVAKLLESKLDATAKANTSKDVNVQI